MYCLGIQCTDAEIKSIHFEVKQKGQLFHTAPEGFCVFFQTVMFFSIHLVKTCVYVRKTNLSF